MLQVFESNSKTWSFVYVAQTFNVALKIVSCNITTADRCRNKVALKLVWCTTLLHPHPSPPLTTQSPARDWKINGKVNAWSVLYFNNTHQIYLLMALAWCRRYSQCKTIETKMKTIVLQLRGGVPLWRVLCPYIREFWSWLHGESQPG